MKLKWFADGVRQQGKNEKEKKKIEIFQSVCPIKV